MELNFESLEMQKWNIATDRAKKVDGKNRVICLVIMFTSWGMVIKMSKMAHFLYFLMMPAKNESWFGQNIYVILFSSLRKCYRLLDSEQPLAWYQLWKMHIFFIFLLTQQLLYVSTLDISRKKTSKPMNHTIFWKNSKRYFRCTF